jgi:hypothetical protein
MSTPENNRYLVTFKRGRSVVNIQVDGKDTSSVVRKTCFLFGLKYYQIIKIKGM